MTVHTVLSAAGERLTPPGPAQSFYISHDEVRFLLTVAAPCARATHLGPLCSAMHLKLLLCHPAAFRQPFNSARIEFAPCMMLFDLQPIAELTKLGLECHMMDDPWNVTCCADASDVQCCRSPTPITNATAWQQPAAHVIQAHVILGILGTDLGSLALTPVGLSLTGAAAGQHRERHATAQQQSADHGTQ